MSAENETIEDIEKKLRELARAIKHTLQMPQAVYERHGRIENKPLDVYFAELADRIEAAWKREVEKLNSVIQATVSRSDAEIDRLRREAEELRKQIGNAYPSSKASPRSGCPGNGAKLREAMVNISQYAECAAMRQHDAQTQEYIEQIHKWANAALKEPARNCDRFPNFNEAIMTYAKERPSDQKKWDMMRYAQFAIWLMALEEETRGDGSPRAKEEGE